jgi:hypothetical protein
MILVKKAFAVLQIMTGAYGVGCRVPRGFRPASGYTSGKPERVKAIQEPALRIKPSEKELEG